MIKKNEQRSREYVPVGPVTKPRHVVGVTGKKRPLMPVDKVVVSIQGGGGGAPGGSAAPTAGSNGQLFLRSEVDGKPITVGKDPIEEAIAAVGGKLTADNVRGLIKAECDELCALLLEKNASYGNSALDPVRLFSKSSPIEQLLVRIDDKLSRISRGDFTKVKEEDLKVVTKDLLGYLILVRVAWRLGME